MKNISGLRILAFGILLAFLGVSLVFMKDFTDGLLRSVIHKSGSVVFIVGFVVGAFGMGKHWVSLYKKLK